MEIINFESLSLWGKDQKGADKRENCAPSKSEQGREEHKQTGGQAEPPSTGSGLFEEKNSK